MVNCPCLCRQYKNPVSRKRKINGVTKHERRHSGFKPDLLTIIEKDVSVDHIIGFNKRSWLMPVDAFSLENREKVFSHSIIIAVVTS